MKKINVGVLMGGMSVEKEVSFNSGRTVCDHLDTQIYNVIPLFQTTDNHLFILPWRFLYRGKITDFLHRLESEAEKIRWDDLKKNIDFMYIATHGRYAEDGTLQGFLEVLKIPYLGAKVLGSAFGMDKIQQKKILSLHNIPVAPGIHVTPQEYNRYKKDISPLLAQLKKEQLAFPLIIKPNQEGSSLGISVVHKKEDLLTALTHAVTIHEGQLQPALIEKKLEGMEYSCIILFDEHKNQILLPPTEVVHESGTEFHDYQQKYMPGRAQKFTPARASEQIIKNIQKTCLQAAHVLELTTIARIDGFVTEDGTVVVIDPNSLSGMAPSSFLFNQAAEIGMSHTDLINHLIKVELSGYGIQIETKKEEAVMKEKKLRVGVLLGGNTHEKEISLESGRNICYKLSPHKYEVTPLFVDKEQELYPLNQRLLVHNSTKEIEHDLVKNEKITWNDLPQKFDFIFIALHGGIGENGSVQGMLEMLKIPYNGSGVAASALCMDKYKTAQFLHAQTIATPLNILLSKETWEVDYKADLKNFIYPLIVKPHNDGCSTFVSRVSNEKELIKTIKTFFKNDKKEVLIEEYIQGIELTVGVIGNKNPQVLPPSQAITNGAILSLEEKFLPGAGQNLTPAPLSPEATQLVQETIAQAYKAAGCTGYARIDCFYQNAQISPTKKERVVVLEINSLPGMTPATCIFHQAAEIGIKPMDFIDLIVSFGLQQHKGDRVTIKRGDHEKDFLSHHSIHTNSSSRPTDKRSK